MMEIYHFSLEHVNWETIKGRGSRKNLSCQLTGEERSLWLFQAEPCNDFLGNPGSVAPGKVVDHNHHFYPLLDSLAD